MSGISWTGSRHHATIPKDPDVQLNSRWTRFPCTDSTVTPSIDSKHHGKCDSPVVPQEKVADHYDNWPGSLTQIFQLERRAELHVSIGDEAWLPCWNSIGTLRSISALERKLEVLVSTPDEDLSPITEWRGIPRGHLEVAWRLDLPDAPQEGHWGPRRNSRGTPSFLPQLEENQEFSPQCEMRPFSSAASREIPPSLLSLKRVLETFDATQEVPHILISIWEEHWGSRHNSWKATFSLLISRWGSISLLRRERNPEVPIAPQEEAVSTWNWRGTPWVVPQFWKTPMSKSTPDTPHSPALIRLSPRLSTPNKMTGVTALWHLERKTQIPMPIRQESDATLTAREESRLASLHTKWGLTPMWKLHRNPEIHVSTGAAPWGSGLHSRWIPRPLHHLESNP